MQRIFMILEYCKLQSTDLIGVCIIILLLYPAMIQYVPYNLAWDDLDHGTGQGLLINLYVCDIS